MTRPEQPVHPGEILRDDVIESLGMTVTQAASQLGVTRAALSRVLNCRAAISPEMAIRLEMWVGGDHGAQAEEWIAKQATYDLWQARKRFKAKIKPLRTQIKIAA
jgi:addiction module HigA family antidote